jgi:hypothetical protein
MSTTKPAKSRATISEQAIRSRVDSGSYQRGEGYFRSGRIFDARRQGSTLKARCEGSQGGPYHVWATIDAKGKITAAECSCPVGLGGACKHVVAMLLTYRARPKEFVEVEELEPALERRSKPELIALIKQMIRREPDLESLLEVPLPGAARAKPASPDVYRRQAESALRGYDPGEYMSTFDVGQDLQPILEIGDEFLTRKDYAGASAVFEGVGSAIFDAYESFDDEGGDVGQVAGRCIDGLAECLRHITDDPARREAILRSLTDGFKLASEFDFADEDVPELIAQHATPEERRTVARWVRGAMEELRGQKYREYERRAYTHFLTAIEKDTLTDEDLLRIYRDEGMTPELVDRLLCLKRYEEAEAELERADEQDVLRLADLFVSHRRPEPAERVVRAWTKKAKSYDTRFLEWLKRRAVARKDKADVRELTEALFRKHPSFAGYKELRGLVLNRGNWDALRPTLLEALERSSKAELIRVHLDEKDLDQAIALVQQERKSRSSSAYGYGYAPYLDGTGMDLEVAKAAEKGRPHAAIEIYRKSAERLVEARGRGNYEQACKLLKRVKALHEKLGEPEKWQYYVGVLRERFSALRAFKEELKSAGL